MSKNYGTYQVDLSFFSSMKAEDGVFQEKLAQSDAQLETIRNAILDCKF